MLIEYPVLKRVFLNKEFIDSLRIHEMLGNDFFLILSAVIFSKKVPYYDLPEFIELNTEVKILSANILPFIQEVNVPFHLTFSEIGSDYIMSLHLQPKPANLCRRVVEKLQPTDRWLMLNISDISEYFVTTTTAIPSFIRLVHEETLIWIMRNLGTSHGHIEFILNTLQTKVKDDFDIHAYPYDNVVLDLLTSSFGAVILMLIDLYERFNLFDDRGRCYWHPAEINKYEVILYDSRLRVGIT